MTITARLLCPNCDKKLKIISPAHRGARFRCPKCGAAFKITTETVRLLPDGATCVPATSSRVSTEQRSATNSVADVTGGTLATASPPAAAVPASAPVGSGEVPAGILVRDTTTPRTGITGTWPVSGLLWVGGRVRLLLLEAVQAARVTFLYGLRVMGYVVALIRLALLERRHRMSQLALAERLYQDRIGDEKLRERIVQLDAQIRQQKEAKDSTTTLEAERTVAKRCLAESYLRETVALPTVQAEFQATREAQNALLVQREETSLATLSLLPADCVTRRRLCFGSLSLALLGLLVGVRGSKTSGQRTEPVESVPNVPGAPKSRGGPATSAAATAAQVRCPTCRGAGSRYATCSRCSGSGTSAMGSAAFGSGRFGSAGLRNNCGACSGSGTIYGPCTACNATGWIRP